MMLVIMMNIGSLVVLISVVIYNYNCYLCSSICVALRFVVRLDGRVETQLEEELGLG